MLANESREQGTSWENQKGKLRRKFTVLRDEDLDYNQQQKSVMLSLLKEKLGVSEERLRIIMDGKDKLYLN
jgi:hypothetical protein